MGPGNTSVTQASSQNPLMNSSTVRNPDPRRRAIARRLSSKSNAIEAGKLSHEPDDKTSFEGI